MSTTEDDGSNSTTFGSAETLRSGFHVKTPNLRNIVDLRMEEHNSSNSTTFGRAENLESEFKTNTPNPQNMIDLTMEDEEDNLNHTDISHQQTTPRVKPELFDDLPELGPTIVPDEIDDGFRVEDLDGNVDQSLEITQVHMADMLKQYQQNVFRAPTPPAEQDSDDEDRAAKVTFQDLKADYENRKRLHGVSLEETIKFTQAESNERARCQARQGRKQQELDDVVKSMPENSMFIPEGRYTPAGLTHVDDESDDDGTHAVCETTVDFTPSDFDENPPTSKQKRGRGHLNGKSPKATEKKTTGNSRVAKQVQKTSTSGARRGRKPKQPPTINTTSLLQNHMDSIIKAANANTKATQPQFSSTNKQDALAQLISSIPAEERDRYIGDKANLQEATKNFNGRGALRACPDGKWLLKGMKSTLHNYQVMGVSWMRSRETQTRNPRGGILSDDMGLGKTVSALANIVDGRPALDYSGPCATLIIVPSGLMNQWLEEVKTHVDIFRSAMIYRSRMKFLDVVASLEKQDIVITSYNEVARSLPANNPPMDLITTRAKEEWYAKEIAEHKGPLHQIFWYRIVLDEAQAIKNHLSKTSEAICYLKGRYRWCLSGTPIQNSLEEFYPYFRFLKCENTGSFDLFKRNFAKRGSEKALQRLQFYLGKIMLRRTHMDKLFGRPIIILPEIKPVETIEVKFNTVERAIYHIVKNRFVTKIRTLTSHASPDSSYQQIFVLLLRLRQLVGHPLLIQKTLKDLLETEDLERLWSLTKSTGSDQTDNDTAVDGSTETAHALQTALTLSSQNSGSSFGLPGSAREMVSDNKLSCEFRKYLQSLRNDGSWAKANERSICSACSSPPSRPWITSCLHLYCLECLNSLYYDEFKQKKDKAVCLECARPIHKNEAYAATAFDEAGSSQRELDGRSTPEEDFDWYRIGGPVLRSAKVKGAVAKIKYWFEQDPTNKIIVFTQFRGLIRVMERVCREEEDWGFASYHGAMSFDYRDEQIHKFSTDPSCKILLAAMKAGGVGLNLTAANRVIILDLWWNACVESQAFTRCFRIGQKRSVEVARFVVHDSVDIDILRMQERKIADIEKAMEEKHRPNKLSVQELMDLFGDQSLRKGVTCGNEQGTGEDDFIWPDDPYDQQKDDEDATMTVTE